VGPFFAPAPRAPRALDRTAHLPKVFMPAADLQLMRATSIARFEWASHDHGGAFGYESQRNRTD
jgi:hypothetical protein